MTGEGRAGVLTDLYSHRALIWAFANRDFATRYRSSVLGWAWSLIQPLATLIVFAAVFSIVFRIEAPPLGNGNGSSYAAFLFTGIVTWNLFSSLLNLSMTQLKSNGELLKKVQFPAWAPVLGAMVGLGVGGYASLPALVAARARRIPAVIHESDAHPGLANRIAVRLGATAAVTPVNLFLVAWLATVVVIGDSACTPSGGTTP